MATLQSLMALYGALDNAVVESGNDEAVAAIVERYLPGSTGPNAGWFREIQEFVGRLPGESLPWPDVDDAANELYERRNVDVSNAEKARMVYAIGALSHLPNVLSRNRETFARALSAVAPEGSEDIDRGLALNELLIKEFTDDRSWARVADIAVKNQLMSAEVAGWLPCDSKLLQIGDLLCLEVNTHFERDTITVDQIKDILEPVNWPALCGFFCSMTEYQPDRPDGWTPALETVSLTCPTQPLRTALKFFKSQIATTDGAIDEVHVDYDLDESPPVPGDGLVTYDRGYLNAARNGANGVVVTTKKVVHIEGLSPVAQNQWVCITGYGSISNEMILGGAENPPKSAKPWTPSTAPTGGEGQGGTYPTEPSTPGSGAATPVAAAVELVSECAQDLAAKTSALAQKWAAGTVTPSDMVAYSAYVGGRGGERTVAVPRAVRSTGQTTTQRRQVMTQAGLGFGFDYLAAGAFNLLSDAGEVADEALEQMKAGTYDAAAFSKSVGALTSLSVQSYLDCAAKAFGTPADGPFNSKDITVKADANVSSRGRHRAGDPIGMPAQVIPAYLVSISPTVLPPGATTFQVCVASATFVGAELLGHGHPAQTRHRRDGSNERRHSGDRAIVSTSNIEQSIDGLLDRAIQAINEGDRTMAAMFAEQVLAVDGSNSDAEDLLTAPTSHGEIRRLTIFFADLVDSTVLSTRIDPRPTGPWLAATGSTCCASSTATKATSATPRATDSSACSATPVPTRTTSSARCRPGSKSPVR